MAVLKHLVTLCATSNLLAHGATLTHNVAFDEYMLKFGRQYAKGSAEYSTRRALFERRSASVTAHNARQDRRWVAEVGMFADRTDPERAMFRGWRRTPETATHGGVIRSSFSSGSSLLETSAMPTTADWRFLETSNMIIDQSACGSCWAATTASVIEAHYEIHHGKARKFSVQEILACTPNPKECGGQGGCQGATVELGVDWVLKNGVNDDETVPYEAADTVCPRDLNPNTLIKSQSGGDRSGMGLAGWQTLPKNEGKPLAKALVEYGPVAISVAADTWHEYGGGIFDGCDKDVIIDHAVTLYGYGEDNGARYWLIRNTWGPDWGEDGYIRMKRHGDNENYCGTDHDNQQGVGCKGDPSTIKVCGMCGMFADSVVPHFAGAKNFSRPGVPSWLLDQASLTEIRGAENMKTVVGASATIHILRRESNHLAKDAKNAPLA